MKTIAICNNQIKRLQPDSAFFEFLLKGERILVGIIETPPTDYEEYIPDKRVLVKVKAFSCNYRDKSLMLNFHKMCEKKSSQLQYLYSPFGSEFVAEVIKAGPDVTELKTGDRVIPDGTYPFRTDNLQGGLPTNYASQRLHVFEENQLIKIPALIPDPEAASFTIASQTVYSMTRKLGISKGSNVLITSATSNTSLAAISRLKAEGVKIYTITSRMSYEKELLALGVDKCIPFDALDNDSIDQYVGNARFDFVIDPFVDVYLHKVIRYMNYNSKYIFCGLYKQHHLFEPLNMPKENTGIALSCISKNISIIGNCLGEKRDLLDAIKDFTDGRYEVMIDSICKGNEILPFLEKTFHLSPRLGKVVYQYHD